MSDADDLSDVSTRVNDDGPPALPSDVSPAPPSVVPGQSIGRYVVLEEIGRGGMGHVLRAYDPKLEREVALKLLHPELLDALNQERLVREALAMAKLSHPNVVAVFDVEDGGSGVVLVMEHVRGQTLRTWLRSELRPWRQIVARFIEAGRGLAAAHAEALLHRDFKPSNVLLPEHGEAKVTDFGLAKFTTGVASTASLSTMSRLESPDDPLTQAGIALGTPRYMAPEQHRGEADHPAVDQYAFCVALWEAVVGKPPFAGSREDIGLEKHRGPPPWPDGVALPRPLVDALLRGLAVEPAARWPSMDALLEALAYDPSRRRRRWLVAVSMLGLLGLGVGGTQWWSQTRAARCRGAAEQLAGVWDETRRGEVEAALLGTDAERVDEAWDRIRRSLDDYAHAFATMHADACEAAMVRGDQSLVVMDRRMACLERARLELSAAVEVLDDGDASVVAHVPELLEGLPPLERCADVGALRERVGPPSPDDAEAVARIRQALARAGAERRAGRLDRAEAHVEQAQAELPGLAHEAIGTEVALEHGRVLGMLRQPEAAEAALRTALESAARFRQREAMADAAGLLLRLVGRDRSLMAEALHYRDLVEGLVHDDPEARAELYAEVGRIRLASEQYVEAEAELRRALDLWQERPGPEEHAVPRLRVDLADALHGQGKVRRAATLAEQAWGQLDRDDVRAIERARAAFTLARISWAEGRDRDRARELATSALSFYERSGEPGAEPARRVRAWLREHG